MKWKKIRFYGALAMQYKRLGKQASSVDAFRKYVFFAREWEEKMRKRNEKRFRS